MERALAEASRAGLLAQARVVRVGFPQLVPVDLVQRRLGLAQHAPYVSALEAGERRALASDALTRLGPDPPALVRSLVVLSALSP